jgi:transposase
MPDSGDRRLEDDSLLRIILRLPQFWRIEEVRVTDRSPEELAKDVRLIRPRGRMDIYLVTQDGALPCPVCGTLAPRHSTRKERVWEDLPIRDYRVFLHARPPRVHCPEHGVHTVATPWASEKSSLTHELECRIVSLARDMPMVRVAEQVWIGRHRVERVIHRWVSRLRRGIQMDQVTAIAVDEKAIQKGHRYVSLVTDQDTHEPLFATEGRGKQVLVEFARELRRHGGDPANIRFVTMDMNAGYEHAVTQAFPNADVVFDKFHIVRHMQDATDQVRREEQLTSPGLKKTRWLFLHNPTNLTAAQRDRLTGLLPIYRRTGRAYNLRLELQEALESGNLAEPSLRRWFFRATHSRLKPVIDVAYMIKRHWHGVIRAIETGLTNAVAEGRNSVIQLAKQRARGFRSPQTFINAIFLVNATLDRTLLTLSGQ